MDRKDEPLNANERALPEWAQWQGLGPMPPSWYAINPDTGERTKIYRSYSDYCD